MKFDQFVGQVQHRARMSSSGEGVAAIRATLETLGEHLFGGEADNLAAQLPQEIGLYLLQAVPGDGFMLDEFFQRVSQREGVDLPEAVYHARVVIEVLADEITRSPVHTAGRRDGEPGYALRFPRLISFRGDDKRPEDATTVREVIAMYDAQAALRTKAQSEEESDSSGESDG